MLIVYQPVYAPLLSIDEQQTKLADATNDVQDDDVTTDIMPFLVQILAHKTVGL